MIEWLESSNYPRRVTKYLDRFIINHAPGVTRALTAFVNIWPQAMSRMLRLRDYARDIAFIQAADRGELGELHRIAALDALQEDTERDGQMSAAEVAGMIRDEVADLQADLQSWRASACEAGTRGCTCDPPF